MKISFLTLLFLTSTTIAEIGERCHWKGLTGKCKKVNACVVGFTVTGACPNDPPDVKCCLGKNCQDPETNIEGSCLDSDRITCGGGSYITGQCPGPAAIQCCVSGVTEQPIPHPEPGPAVTTPAPVPTHAPSAPKCPKIRVSNSFGVFTYKFSQDLTNDLKEPGIVAGGLAAACATFIGLTSPTVALPIAIAAICGIGGAELGVLAGKADSCDDKEPAQCLMVKYFPFSAVPIPFCIGANDGCCGGALGGKSEGFIVE